MKPTTLCLAFSLAILSLHGGPAAAQPKTPEKAAVRPNIVLILADDLGIHDLGCYGRADHRTPNLDRLAADGARFTTPYCALPICSASRAGLLTSKFPARLHLTTYLPGRPDAPSQKLLQPRIEPALIPSEQTIAEVLKREGYATGVFGKWHLGGRDSAAAAQGFDEVFEPAGNGDPATDGGKNEFAITRKAIEFIQAARDKPYFCYVPHHSPHIMLQELRAKIESNSEAWNPLYAATIQSLDESIGELLKAIDASPGAENTIVIFTSDNGGLHVPELHELPVTHNGPFRAGKGYLYEGGLRVPLLIRWPTRIQKSTQVETPVSLLDILPTLLETAQIKPSSSVGPIDGQSLLPLFSDAPRAKTDRERTFYWHLPHYTNQGSRPAGALRRGIWKLVEDYETDSVELFDLSKDAEEQHNVATQQPELAAELKADLSKWRKSVAAQECTANPQFDAAMHRAIYVDRDSSKLVAGKSTAQQVADEWRPWRKAMNAAVQGRTPLLNNAASAIRLLASEAKPHGSKLRYEPETYKNVLGYWTQVDDWAEWQFGSTISGEVEVQIHFGCGAGNGGSEVDVIIETEGAPEQRIAWTVRETGHFQNIVVETVGTTSLSKGQCRLIVRPKKKPGAAVVDIRQIILAPVSRSAEAK